MGPGTTRKHPGLRLSGPNGVCKAERERQRGRETETDRQRERERKTPDRHFGNNDKERTNQ